MKLSQGKRLLLLGVVLVVIDQVIKYLVKTNMELGEQIPVIGQWFRLCFVENEGMAFGVAFGGQVGKFLLSLFRIVLSGALIWWIRSLIKKESTPAGVPVGLTLITAGAIGNIIDCLFYGLIWGYAPFMFGKVVDMFFFPIIREIGVNPIHFAMIICTNLAIGQVTPPFGCNLFVACGVGKVGLESISRRIVPFILALLICVLLVTYLEPISLFLPRLLGAKL